MTRDPHPVLVGGDELAGFFRARDPVVGPVPVDGDRDEGPRKRLHVREVLSWGGQTSGSIRHAFWVLLLPFAVFNVAGRMHVVTSPARAALHRALCRVLALAMTLAVVVIAGGVAFDLVAVQCGGSGQVCLGTEADGPWFLAPFRRYDADVVRRLGLAALLPAGLVVALWYAGRYRTRSLEGYSGDADPRAGQRRTDEPTSIADLDFWRNAWPASRLRGLHATAGFAVAGLTLALSLHAVKADLPGQSGAWLILAAVEAVIVMACLGVAAMPGMATPGPDRPLHLVLLLLRAVAVAVLAFSLGFALLGQVTTDGDAPGGVTAGPRLGLIVAALAFLAWVAWTWSKAPPAVAPDDDPADEQPNVSIGVANLPLAGAFLLAGWAAGRAFPAAWGPTGALRDPVLGTIPEALGWLEWADVLMPGVFTPPYLPLLALVCIQALLVVGLLLVSVEFAPQWRADRSELDSRGPVPFNLTAVVVTLLSFLLITAIGAGLHTVVLDALGERTAAIEETADGEAGAGTDAGTDEVADAGTEGEAASEEQAARLVLPWWQAVAALVLAGMLVIVLVVVVAQMALRRDLRPGRTDVAQHLERAETVSPDADLPADAERLEEIGRIWMVQRLIRDGGTMLTWVVGLTLVALTIFVIVRADAGIASPLPLTTPAVLLVSAIPVVAIAMVRRSLQDRDTRRDIGRLWDVLTFWPRITHPFAPPCYSEAVVPMLEHRLRLLLAAPSRYRVILAGHSQGSVVSLAAAARLGSLPTQPPDPPESRPLTPYPDPEQQSRVDLVTYGSPIAILYERYFPATLRLGEGAGPTVFDHVRDRVHTWHHLFALTEPFAYPFWASAPPLDVDDDALVRGWPLTSLLARVDGAGCPACRPPGDDGFRPTVDLVVIDPDRWRLPDGGPTKPAGHSTYHRHRDVDRHLARIVARSTADAEPGAAAAGAADAGAGAADERRSVGWWRTGP